MKMVAAGINVVDYYLDQKLYYPGGNSVNVAVNCKRNGFEECSYIGIFADDDKAQHIQWALNKEGVVFDRSRFVKGISSQPGVFLTEKGDRQFVDGPKNAVQHALKLKFTVEDLSFLSEQDVCHSCCYASIEEELPKLQSRVDVSFDFSGYRDKAYLDRVCPHIKYGFFSGSGLTDPEVGELMQHAQDLGTGIVGVTLAEKGAVFLKDGTIYEIGAKLTKVVDTMGAGDSFIAGFLTGFLLSGDMERALDYAAACAAETCTFFGSFGYPISLGDKSWPMQDQY